MNKKKCKFCGSKMLAPLLAGPNGKANHCSNENCSSHVQGELTMVAGGVEVLGWLKDYIPRKDVRKMLRHIEHITWRHYQWGDNVERPSRFHRLKFIKPYIEKLLEEK